MLNSFFCSSANVFNESETSNQMAIEQVTKDATTFFANQKIRQFFSTSIETHNPKYLSAQNSTAENSKLTEV